MTPIAFARDLDRRALKVQFRRWRAPRLYAGGLLALCGIAGTIVIAGALVTLLP